MTRSPISTRSFDSTVYIQFFKVVAKLTPREGNLFAINSFGMGGTNSHVLLSPHKKEKKFHESNENERLPRLVTISGRTEEAVNVIRNDVSNQYTFNKLTVRIIYNMFVKKT